MQRETAKKEAWRPKCAAPRLVYDSALVFETFMHAYVRTTYDEIHSAKKRKNPSPRRSGLGMDMWNMCANFQGLSLKNGVDIWTLILVRKTCVFYAVASNYLVLV